MQEPVSDTTGSTNPGNAALIIVFTTALMDSIGFGIMLPVLPELLMEIDGRDLSSAAQIGGLLMVIFAVTQFVFSPLLGNLSDAIGRRPVLLVSLGVASTNYVLMGLAETLTFLIIGRILTGMGSATLSTCNAYIADTTKAEKRTQYFGMIGAAFGLGFVIGPIIGGLIGDFGIRTPFFVAGALLGLNLLMGLLLLPESLDHQHRRAFTLKTANPISTLIRISQYKTMLGLLCVIFVYQLGHHVLPSVWSYFTIQRFSWNAREIGYSMGFIGLLMALVQGVLIKSVLSKIGLKGAGIVGMSCTIIAFLGYAGAIESWMMYLAMIPGALGALAGPALNGMASAKVDKDRQGELQGGLASLMSLASIIGPPLMTQTFYSFSQADKTFYFPGAPFLLAAILTLISLLIFTQISKDSSSQTSKNQPTLG
ncbi:MAG: TCR/Tet family MFS transporter [Gammaproteobacteria bacterium]|nr:TCR/Tet family MFS transporter [Gammaproteobacteria bacterium]MBT5202849.1 TCR/Tet family MFS transporter [Gammaproteobacteria bacterium]MBT6246014.1 TCR/Tet family MFS transporter [Gammaproteobacteria bacterium]